MAEPATSLASIIIGSLFTFVLGSFGISLKNIKEDIRSKANKVDVDKCEVDMHHTINNKVSASERVVVEKIDGLGNLCEQGFKNVSDRLESKQDKQG